MDRAGFDAFDTAVGRSLEVLDFGVLLHVAESFAVHHQVARRRNVGSDKDADGELHVPADMLMDVEDFGPVRT